MIDRPLTKPALEEAMRRVDDFYSVQKDSQWADLVLAMTVFKESLGIKDEVQEELVEWADSRFGDSPHIILGIMVGLIAADYEFSAT